MTVGARLAGIALLALIAITQTSCTYSISNDARYPTDYAVGNRYWVERPLIALADRGPFAARAKPVYPADLVREVDGMKIPVGTLIEIKEVTRENRMGTIFVWVIAEIVSGSPSDHLLELHGVSAVADGMPRVDVRYLRLAG